MWNINKVEKTVGNVGHSQSSAAEISGNLLHRSAFNRGENGSLTVAAEKFSRGPIFERVCGRVGECVYMRLAGWLGVLDGWVG